MIETLHAMLAHVNELRALNRQTAVLSKSYTGALDHMERAISKRLLAMGQPASADAPAQAVEAE